MSAYFHFLSETLRQEYKYRLRVCVLLARGTKVLISKETVGVAIYKIASFL